jgi:hypothetical protein
MYFLEPCPPFIECYFYVSLLTILEMEANSLKDPDTDDAFRA